MAESEVPKESAIVEVSEETSQLVEAQLKTEAAKTAWEKLTAPRSDSESD